MSDTHQSRPAAAAARAVNVEERCRSLMERYQAGDSGAAEELVRNLSPMLLRYCNWGARAHDGEDLLQETWLRIHRVRHTFQPGSPVLPWVFAIAQRVRIDAYRRRAVRKEVAADPLPEPPAAPRPSSGLDVDALLGSLPESQREVLYLMKVEGLSIQDVARIKGATVGAIKLRAHRAYEALRKTLGRKDTIA